ncbi:MAG: patatin-like phospholipase family protein [Acetobacteraceae bacterium]
MKRILAIDGGGIRGAWPAAFMADLEESTGRRIVDTFDLIVGTSTGGIIALGLGLGISTADIVRLYEERGPAIFDPPGKSTYSRPLTIRGSSVTTGWAWLMSRWRRLRLQPTSRRTRFR